MRKYLVFCFLFLLCGCSKNESAIETIVETNNNVVIAINYPVTNKSKLDVAIEDYISNIYKGFKDEYENFKSLTEKSELNIDYQYQIINKRYLNIALNTFINSSKLAHPINEIKTFVFDNEANKILSLSDLVNEKNLNKMVPILKQDLVRKYGDCIIMELLTSEVVPIYDNYQYFTFDSNNITFYFNPYKISNGSCNIINSSIPLKDLDINLGESNEVVDHAKELIVSNSLIIDPTKPAVALTFDDGPSKYTNEIIDLLNEYNASATFFVLGNKVKIYEKTINRIVTSGNEIGNHTYNHKWLMNLTEDEFDLQIEKTQDIIREVSGYVPRLFRPSYGSVNSKIRSYTDLEIILWDVDSLDWKLKNSSRISDRVLTAIDDLDIVLFHDTYERTLKALKIIIPKLIENGYQIVTVSELTEIKEIRKQL